MTDLSSEVSLACKSHDSLGEGAIWNYKTQQLYWIDIEKGIFHTLHPESNTHHSFSLGQRVGTAVPSENGNIIVALQDGIYEFSLVSHKKKLIAHATHDTLTMRFNDGKCDPSGRLWVGTMHLNILPEVAALFKVDGGNMEKMLNSITISNGICWSLDSKSMYYIDTPTSTIKAFDFDKVGGTISNGRVVILTTGEFDPPDGMTIDEEGMLWIAHWKGGCVGRWNPQTGKLVSKIKVPSYHVTSCAFGGENLDTLYITTASIEVSPEQEREYPLAGCVFKVKPGVKGCPAYFYKN